MPHRRTFSWTLAAALTFALSAGADQHPTVDDLAWMTGSWAGPVGGGMTLEENWILPVDGSMASLVRMTGNGATSMVEMIVIEEENDSLVLRLQQWDPGFVPRTPGPHTLTLRELGDNRVSFEAGDDAAFRNLTYSRPEPDTFVIEVDMGGGQQARIELQAR
ncbi:MAG: DUF6265 family protein [Gammaproteobacteria bacterium]|nr:DUF6265 family protein [Gammaproteobacteria bacterium]